MKVLVVGDIVKDHYIYGTMSRINPEGPAPLVSKTHETTKLGGAYNVWENLTSLGVDCDIIRYDSEYISRKTRIICDGHYITRLDDDKFYDGAEMLRAVKTLDLSQYKYIILSDYNKGALSKACEIIEYANSFGCKVIVDPKTYPRNYYGAWLIKPNNDEYVKYGYDGWWGNIIHTSANNTINSRFDGQCFNIEIHPVEVADVTGAGDCFLAAFVYGLTKGYNYRKCVEIAAAAATRSVTHQGTYTLKPEDVEQKVVFTNGCFDILHRGHIEYLEQSKALGSKLVIGLNSDKSVRQLKGASRPINNENDRKKALEALRCVDNIIIFDEDTPYDLIKYIKPDIITKGGDYKPEDVVGNDLADVVILPFVENYSTTNIVSKLNDQT